MWLSHQVLLTFLYRFEENKPLCCGLLSHWRPIQVTMLSWTHFWVIVCSYLNGAIPLILRNCYLRSLYCFFIDSKLALKFNTFFWAIADSFSKLCCLDCRKVFDNFYSFSQWKYLTFLVLHQITLLLLHKILQCFSFVSKWTLEFINFLWVIFDPFILNYYVVWTAKKFFPSSSLFV